MRWSWPAVILSAVLSVVSLVSLGWQGLNFAIDFTGGTIIEVAYQEPADLEEVRQQLKDAGFANPIVQHFGTTREVLIRLAPQEDMAGADLRTRVMDALRKDPAVQAELHRIEFVGPQVGEDLAES